MGLHFIMVEVIHHLVTSLLNYAKFLLLAITHSIVAVSEHSGSHLWLLLSLITLIWLFPESLNCR